MSSNKDPKKPSGALHKIFAARQPMEQYRNEIKLKCAAMGLNLNDKSSMEKTAREISQIIRAWLEKKNS